MSSNGNIFWFSQAGIYLASIERGFVQITGSFLEAGVLVTISLLDHRSFLVRRDNPFLHNNKNIIIPQSIKILFMFSFYVYYLIYLETFSITFMTEGSSQSQERFCIKWFYSSESIFVIFIFISSILQNH